jgi:hypothetical protein
MASQTQQYYHHHRTLVYLRPRSRLYCPPYLHRFPASSVISGIQLANTAYTGYKNQQTTNQTLSLAMKLWLWKYRYGTYHHVRPHSYCLECLESFKALKYTSIKHHIVVSEIHIFCSLHTKVLKSLAYNAISQRPINPTFMIVPLNK